MTCISCHTEHHGKFCPNCGEKYGVKKITFNSIIQDTLSTITDMDKGFLYNLKMLTFNPRQIAVAYISGKRKGILNPISYLIIAISIYLIIETFFKLPRPDVNHKSSSEYLKIGYDLGKAAGTIIFTYFKYFWVLSIMLLANSTKLIFQKFNYLEHVAISAFIIGQATLVGIIGFFMFNQPLIFNPLLYLTIVLLIYFIFKQDQYKITSVVSALGGLVLFIIQLFILVIILGIMYL